MPSTLAFSATAATIATLVTFSLLSSYHRFAFETISSIVPIAGSFKRTRVWQIGVLSDVPMTIENTVHYALDTKRGLDEWGSILPREGSTLRLGRNGSETFTISLFHQLHCLNTIKDAIVEFQSTRRAPDHSVSRCMDYLRQKILCRSDLRLESGRNPEGPGIAVADVTHSCKDWTRAFDEAQRNREAWGAE